MARRSILPAYCAVAAADVVLAGRGNRRARRVTKSALMPMLAADMVRADGADGTKKFVLAGLGMSWLGDVALLGKSERALPAGLGSFLVAHGCYLAAFAKRRRGGALNAPWAVATYALAWAALNAVLFPRTGRLRVPVIVYGTALAAMAVAALDTDEPAIAAGGAAFFLSDSILALRTFGEAQSRIADSAVMLTYTAAQALIAHGMVGDG